MAVEGRQAVRQRAGATIADQQSLVVIRWLTLFAVVLADIAVGRARAVALPANRVSFGVGLVLIWAGIGLRWWSFRTLGRYFTFKVMTSPDQQVITAGPYRFVRHPSYAAILVVLIGIGVVLGNWLSLAVLVVLPLIGFIRRMQVEEAALARTLGSSYTSYASHHKRLIPGVW